MLKIFTLCLAFMLSTPLLFAAAAEGETLSAAPHLKVGNVMLRTNVLKAAEDHILEEQYHHTHHAPFATHVAPFLASVDNPHNMVAVIKRLSGYGFLLCTDDETAQTTAQLLRIGYEWFKKNSQTVAGTPEDLLTAATGVSHTWDSENVVLQLTNHLLGNADEGNDSEGEGEGEGDSNSNTSSEEDHYQSLSDAEVEENEGEGNENEGEGNASGPFFHSLGPTEIGRLHDLD